MAKSKEELKRLFMNVNEESEKTGFKLNIQKNLQSITSWQVGGEKCKQWQISFSWAPKSLQMVTTAIRLKDTCSLEEKL